MRFDVRSVSISFSFFHFFFLNYQFSFSDINVNGKRHNSIIMNREINYHPFRHRRNESMNVFSAEILANLNGKNK